MTYRVWHVCSTTKNNHVNYGKFKKKSLCILYYRKLIRPLQKYYEVIGTRAW